MQQPHRQLTSTGDDGLAGLKQMLPDTFRVFPDMRTTITDMVAEKDKVVVFVASRGTHRGEYMGVPPTGRRLEWTSIDLYRFEDEKIVEHRGVDDAVSLLGQMGVL